ncbi:META domain-containing protein [Methylocystis echinoides]|jgi:heat shock protein HslJ|uniref:META domain-containing protein n=1 Tax=Methylocystis echinoides TaxID=29468 RepID=UPI003441FED3
MNKPFSILALALGVAMVAAPAHAKKKAQPAEESQGQEQQQQDEGNKETGGIPRYVPFPHNRNFVLKEINGKAPPVEIWINIDSTGRANGFSGCKNWSGVFVIGPDRLGPRAMPAVNERQCDGALAGIERDLWGVLLSGPYWDVKGDDLTLRGYKGGVLKFQRSL